MKKEVAFSIALASKLVVKASAGGVLYTASGRLDATAPTGTYYLQLWDLPDVPAEGTKVTDDNSLMAPQKIVHTLGTDDTVSLDFGGMDTSRGIAFGLSTDEFIKTAAGAYLSLTVEFQ